MEINEKTFELWRNSTLMGALGIEIISTANNCIIGSMPVDHRTHQPYGLLHGGASAALAETLASLGSVILAQQEGNIAVGLDLSMSHLKAKRHGKVTGTAILRKGGKQVHVWDIEIKDEEGELISVGRMSALVQQPKSK